MLLGAWLPFSGEGSCPLGATAMLLGDALLLLLLRCRCRCRWGGGAMSLGAVAAARSPFPSGDAGRTS